MHIMQSVGGLGLFLLGMIWLTEGLRGVSGRAMRGALVRFTRTPLSGALTGAAATALLQSSSATTVTAVSFVGAGVLTFPQALGVIFGANVGTTVTGWMVALLGFKLHLGEVVMPLVLVAALLQLFGGARVRLIGTAVAGFSLLFIGIDAMQSGMAALEGVVTPSVFPDDTFAGRLLLVLIGVLITLVTQSSSAGVATALAAVGAGAISLPQAAAMVIGMDVGTTFTAALATIGGGVATRRTGLSHVIYNVLTGAVALLLLDLFARLAAPLVDDGGEQIALVAFHTSFNLLGAILVLPLAGPFARLVIALVPDRGSQLTRRLDRQVLQDPALATDAVAATVEQIANAQYAILSRWLSGDARDRGDSVALRTISDALTETRGFIQSIQAGATNPEHDRALSSALHALDHMRRLYYRCTQTARIETLGADGRLRRLRGVLGRMAGEAAAIPPDRTMEQRFKRLRSIMRKQREIYRTRIIALAARRRIDDEDVAARLDASRWMHRVSYHLWRIEHHLERIREVGVPASARREAAIEVLED